MVEERVEIEIVEKGRISLAEIQREARNAISDIAVEGTAANLRAKEAGINVSALSGDADSMLTFKPAAAGIGTVEIVLLALGPVAYDIWKHVVLAHIRDKWGDHAIKAKRAAAKAAEKASVKAPSKTPKSKK